MGFLLGGGHSWDDENPQDDGSMFGGADRMDEKRAKLARAKEIADGIATGMFERDEEVLQMVRDIEEKTYE